MGSAGVGLVMAAPDRPVQAVCDGVVVVAVEVKEPTDFCEAERDEPFMGGFHGRRDGFGGNAAAVV
jgi:hypothetical protein